MFLMAWIYSYTISYMLKVSILSEKEMENFDG
jgi:hypothetical protein